eukprot:CAMPEP_0168606654 /NCGR_PEP_ID=MMETSP0420-20121227/16703_1 /TAXON_ID=498008 /ORGANISM="Pessonella sp." /LENGTH=173 /DNA_ID=CAMNT_0008646367 /DNA_START=197 /DNA_END=718 /DNA_ORIENTATION=+
MVMAEAMLDAARLVNPNIIIVAELFTGDEDKDAKLCGRLGLSALIREAIHKKTNKDLSAACYSHGVQIPIGAPTIDRVSQPNFIALPSKLPPALFMDCTHDNHTPHETFTAEHALATMALTMFSNCAAGSVRTHDSFRLNAIDLVQEKRIYQPLKNVSSSTSIIIVKTIHERK